METYHISPTAGKLRINPKSITLADADPPGGSQGDHDENDRAPEDAGKS